MTLRLVLVSLVAALGFTIPSAAVIESWVVSTQDWMNARLADWDTRDLQSTDYVITSDFRVAGLPVRRPSRLTVSAITPGASSRPVMNSQSLARIARTSHVRPVKFVPKCGAYETLEIGERPATNIAFRLNPRNDRGPAELEGPPAPFSSRIKFDAALVFGKAARQLTGSLETTAGLLAGSLPCFRFSVARHPKTEPGSLAKACQTELAADFRSKTQELGIKLENGGAPHCRAIASESFGAMEQSQNLYFAGELPNVSAPLVVTPPSSKPCSPQGLSTEVASGAARSSIAASASTVEDDIDEETTGSLGLPDDGFGRPVAKPTMTQQAPVVVPENQNVARKSEEVARIVPRSAIKPSFEPLEVGENRCAGITFDLNRRNDGSEITVVPAVARAAPGSTVPRLPVTKAELVPPRLAPDLRRAVKLTREAVYAWVDVLAGPSIVTVAQPNSDRLE
jgi:hypothetical protein